MSELKEAAVCIVEHNGYVLLLQRTKEPYGFGLPGGKIEVGESNLDGCVRELKEETDIDFNYQGHGYLGHVKSGLSDRTVHVFYMRFYGEPGDVLLSSEHNGYAWTKKPEHGFELAGNTDKMFELWREM